MTGSVQGRPVLRDRSRLVGAGGWGPGGRGWAHGLWDFPLGDPHILGLDGGAVAEHPICRMPLSCIFKNDENGNEKRNHGGETGFVVIKHTLEKVKYIFSCIQRGCVFFLTRRLLTNIHYFHSVAHTCRSPEKTAVRVILGPSSGFLPGNPPGLVWSSGWRERQRLSPSRSWAEEGSSPLPAPLLRTASPLSGNSDLPACGLKVAETGRLFIPSDGPGCGPSSRLSGAPLSKLLPQPPPTRNFLDPQSLVSSPRT